MKRYLILIICTFLFINCCEDDDSEALTFKIIDGYYFGKFSYHGQFYWSQIRIEKNKYEERLVGGVGYPKEYHCLTFGTVSVLKDILTFKLDSFKYKHYYQLCEPDMILPGYYKINEVINNDSIIFSKGVGSNKIVYYLKIIDL